jgi:hypothetical protein
MMPVLSPHSDGDGGKLSHFFVEASKRSSGPPFSNAPTLQQRRDSYSGTCCDFSGIMQLLAVSAVKRIKSNGL